MPEKHFEIRWPNGAEETCYSPSTVISNYIKQDENYPLEEFVSLTEKALTQASERVREKYGYACSSAMDQLTNIKTTAKQFEEHPNPIVFVKKMI